MNYQWIVVSLFSSLMCGLTAALKARSPLPWAAFGFVSPLAVLVVLCMKSIKHRSYAPLWSPRS